MRYYSTRDKTLAVGFQEAVQHGLAPDGGLFFPDRIERLSEEFFRKIPEYSLPDIGMYVLRNFIPPVIEDHILRQVLDQALNFPIPIVKVTEHIFALELFHGPTLAFKDFGARFMGHILPYCMDRGEEITVLVATSGDTGSAVAHGFYTVPGVHVVVLYPKGKVSALQELQMTTLGENITAIAVEGTFDDCQKLVKQMFTDGDLNKRRALTSANSINIARWLPQSLYYFLTQKVLKSPVIAVPSGNLGNFTAGVLAQRMGLPVSHFIAACNANDVIPQYLQTGKFIAKSSIRTVANAMDVGNPSNFERLLELYHGDYLKIKASVNTTSYTDAQILYTIKTCYDSTGYVLDPHGATAYQALFENGGDGVFLATAHPAKFADIYDVLGIPIDTPESLRQLEGREIRSISMGSRPEELKEFLLGPG